MQTPGAHINPKAFPLTANTIEIEVGELLNIRIFFSFKQTTISPVSCVIRLLYCRPPSRTNDHAPQSPSIWQQLGWNTHVLQMHHLGLPVGKLCNPGRGWRAVNTSPESPALGNIFCSLLQRIQQLLSWHMLPKKWLHCCLQLVEFVFCGWAIGKWENTPFALITLQLNISYGDQCYTRVEIVWDFCFDCHTPWAGWDTSQSSTTFYIWKRTLENIAELWRKMFLSN